MFFFRFSSLKKTKKIFWYAIASRLLCIGLILFWSSLLNDYDSSNNIFPNCSRWLRPFAHWDGVYFIRTAQMGYYTFEHMHAFFPGLSVVIYSLEGWLSFLFSSRIDRLVFAGLLVSNISFVFASLLLFQIGLRVLDDPRIAYLGALCFTFPISNVFMSVVYTESSFCFFTFLGFYALFCVNSVTVCSIIFFFVSFFRSNGLLNIPFLISYAISRKSFFAFFLIGIPVIPLYVYINYFSYNLYCPGRPWCVDGNIYNFIQKKHWDVGLFRYYSLHNIPNFVLATPIFYVATSAIIHGVSNRYGPFKSPMDIIRSVWMAANDYKMSPFVFQLAALGIVTGLFANVQVFTRLAVACPLLHWEIARLWIIGGKTWKCYSLIHCLYFFIGPVFFSNFLPWT